MSATVKSTPPPGFRDVSADELHGITGGGLCRWIKDAVAWVKDKISPKPTTTM